MALRFEPSAAGRDLFVSAFTDVAAPTTSEQAWQLAHVQVGVLRPSSSLTTVELTVDDCTSFSLPGKAMGHSATMPFCPLRNVLRVGVCRHDDTWAQDTLVGYATLPLVAQKREASFELPLMRTSAITRQPKIRGFVRIRVYILGPQRTLPVPRLLLTSNLNLRGGLLLKMVDGGTFRAFRTFALGPLWRAHTFLPHPTPWNSGYVNAQRIFSRGARPAAVRAAIRMQHSTLYAKHMPDMRLVRGAEELFRALQDQEASPSLGSGSGSGSLFSRPSSYSGLKAWLGGRGGAQGRRFTYVLREDGVMHFSETSASRAQDMLSKHALHNNARAQVLFAGEFFFDLCSDRAKASGRPALVVDNNSGTYAPAAALLASLRGLLETNLGLEWPIMALDRSDPLLEVLKRANLVN